VLVLIIIVVGAFFVYRYHEQHSTVFAPTSDTLAPASAAVPAARDTVPARSN